MHAITILALAVGISVPPPGGSTTARIDKTASSAFQGQPEQYVVRLRGRTFSLRDERAAILAAPRSSRPRMIQALKDKAREDQRSFREFVEARGGRVVCHYWFTSACVIEIDSAKLAEVKGHERCIAISPVTSRLPAMLPPRPEGKRGAPAPEFIGTCTDQNNHNVAAAHALLGQKGAGVVIGVFDTGLDTDQGGAPPVTHDTFDDPAGGPTRLLASFNVGATVDPHGVDCNSVHPYCAPSTTNRAALHGTAVAGIALGNGYQTIASGHAPEAQAVGFSITKVDPPTSLWITDETIMLAAIQRAREWLLGGDPLDIVNLSFHGWSDPDNVTQQELDRLERDWDILIVTAAGNEGDSTKQSNGFCNGLSVGAVHTRLGSTEDFIPMVDSSRGPLFGNPARFYPDVCASGAVDKSYYLTQIRMPHIDWKDTSCQPPNPVAYVGRGTSMSAPQVSGAAALYRAERPQASALETKAAILLTVQDPLPAVHVPGLPGPWDDGQHTYRNRNTYGVGYTRDDLLAAYAVRQAATDLGQALTLDPQSPDATVTYGGLTASKYYAVVIVWPRVIPDDEAPSWPLANVDLEVWLPAGSAPIAMSRTPANSYERLVFQAPSGTTSVDIKVRGVELHEQTVPVYLAARGLGTSVEQALTGEVAVLEQPGSCVASAKDQRISTVIPSSYSQAYGSAGFTYIVGPQGSQQATDRYRGMGLIAPWTKFGQYYYVNTIISNLEIDVAGSITIGGLAMRSWRPFLGSTGTITVEELRMYDTNSPYPPPSPYMYPPSVQPVATNVVVQVQSPAWSAQGWNTWPVVVPLNQGPYIHDNAYSLGIWIKMSTTMDYFEVDGPSDPGWQYYSLSTGNYPGKWGETFVFGLMEGATADLTPILGVYGEPSVGHDILLQVRQAPAGNVVLFAGGPGSGTIGPGCVYFSDAHADIVPLTTSSMGDVASGVSIPANPSLLFQQVYYQAAGGPLGDILSNGIRLTIGGSH